MSTGAPGRRRPTTSPKPSVTGSWTRPLSSRHMPSKPGAVGTPTRFPSMSYTQAWKGQVKRRASPEPSTTRTPRCRHTLAMARTMPSRSLVSRTGVPQRSTVQKDPGRGRAPERQNSSGESENSTSSSRSKWSRGRVGGSRHLHDVVGHVGRLVLDVVEQATNQAVLERFPVHRDPLGPIRPFVSTRWQSASGTTGPS